MVVPPPDVSRSAPVAILAPTGRDSAIACEVLERAGFATVVCADVAALCAALGDDAGALLVAEEALPPRAREALIATLDAQPPWSEIPLVVLTGEAELSRGIPPGLQLLSDRANVTLLERPVRVTTLVTTLRSALHGRRRQLELRDRLEERRVVELTLRESESRLRDAVLSAPYPLMLYAEDGEILQLSRAWTTLTGYAEEELRTTGEWTARGVIAADVPDAFEPDEFAGAAVPDSSLPAREWRVCTAAGEERTWDVHTVELVPLSDGRRLRLTAAVDVTAYRQLLALEREARAEAEAARAEAEEANRAKSEFLAVMSHELRTPLNAIAGYAQLIALGVRGPVTVEQQVDLLRIDKSQRHLLSLINDILNFAKIEAGHVAFDIGPVPVREVLKAVGPLVAPQLEAKALTYVDSGRSCDAVVLADAEKAQQILLNLLSNAIKFTPAGGRIAVDCTVADDRAHLTVSDSGIGIPPDKLGAIFEPFVQVERHFASRHEGTGLGLSISRDLARRMGGDLSVTSVLGRGAAFTLTLPLAS